MFPQNPNSRSRWTSLVWLTLSNAFDISK
jgi:hypothetical protein